MGNTARGMAFRTIAVILAGTAIGSMLPETGNVAAGIFNLPAHIFNQVFLIVGVTGVMLALFTGHRQR